MPSSRGSFQPRGQTWVSCIAGRFFTIWAMRTGICYSVAQPLFATPWTAANLSFTISQSLLKFMSIELVMPSNHLIPCHLLLLLPSIFPSIRVFSNESTFHTRWPKYWSFSFSISSSKEYSGLICFRIYWTGIEPGRLENERNLEMTTFKPFIN